MTAPEPKAPASDLDAAVGLLNGRCAAIDQHYARFPDSLDRTMEDTATAIRTVLDALSSQSQAAEGMAKALERQSDNMAFVLNRVDLHRWHEKFEDELAEDRTALSHYRTLGDRHVD